MANLELKEVLRAIANAPTITYYTTRYKRIDRKPLYRRYYYDRVVV